MTLVKTLASALAMIVISATVTSADGITINDAYARSAGKTAKAGAAFFMIANDSDQEDRLIDVMSSAAKKVELHTHVDQGDGVMKMVHVKEGLPLFHFHFSHILNKFLIYYLVVFELSLATL